MSTFVTDTEVQMRARLAELRPQIREYERLKAAADALAAIAQADVSRPRTTPAQGPSVSQRSSTKRMAGRVVPRGRRPTGDQTVAGRAGRPRGRLWSETLALVQQRPGVALKQLADELDAKVTSLLRVLHGLAKEGKVRKEGRGWHPTEDRHYGSGV